MSKASVAQEPSMDEILASIRRIIETGEDRSGSAARAVPAEPAQDAAPRAGSQLPRLSERFEARDTLSYTRAINPVLTAAAADSVAGAGEPVAVEVTGIAPSDEDEDRLTADLEQELAASWGQPDPIQNQPPAFEPAPPPPPALPEDAAPMSDPSSFERRPEIQPREVPLRDEMQVEPPAADRATFQPANSDRPALRSEDAYEAVTLPLTSEATGTLVAASFNDLAQAIRSGELRSIEAMAQEMLRPMLQDWLDDNLPRIVERLVRDEIERMSRGGRR